MIDELKPYARHRATDVYWLPQVPSHWNVMRSKHVFAERIELARAGDVQLSATQAYGVIPQAEFEKRVGRRVVRISMYLDKRSHVEKGDFVISMRSFQGGLERAWASGAIRSSYVVLRPARDLDLGYFTHLFKAQPYIKALQATGNFIRDGQDLTFGNFSRVDLPFPPKGEQIAIGRFLDHANRRIDQFIRAKKKLIALLNEQKQAIIHRAVTRGLDPKARLKDSNVRWLGHIPAHWQVAALRHRYTQRLGKMLDAKRITGAHLIPYLRNTDVQWGGINTRNLPEMDIQRAEYVRYTVQAGDLLVCEGGEVGRCAIWDGELAVCGFQKALHRLRPTNAIRDDTRFMAIVLRTAAKAGAFETGRVSTIAHLTGDQLRAHRFPFPPRVEQTAIVDSVAAATLVQDRALASTEREIALTREYRTRLIADVVTGQLDVRAAAVSLPDLEPEIAPVELDDDTDSDIDDGEAA
jgi:type I restriction enzyme, S subunit